MEDADNENYIDDGKISDHEGSEIEDEEKGGYEVMRPNINKFQYKMMYDPEKEIVKVQSIILPEHKKKQFMTKINEETKEEYEVTISNSSDHLALSLMDKEGELHLNFHDENVMKGAFEGELSEHQSENDNDDESTLDLKKRRKLPNNRDENQSAALFNSR